MASKQALCGETAQIHQIWPVGGAPDLDHLPAQIGGYSRVRQEQN
jgi:hypothetical protein